MNYVPWKLLIWLYKRAELFVFPSIYEGFGFPPMEAASLGTLSVVSNVSSIPEVCGDYAIYFNPYDVKDIALQISEGLYNDNLRETKRGLIEKNLNRFSWKENAEKTLNIYRTMI